MCVYIGQDFKRPEKRFALGHAQMAITHVELTSSILRRAVLPSPKYFAACITKDCFHYEKQKSGEEKICLEKSKRCPVSQAPSRD